MCILSPWWSSINHIFESIVIDLLHRMTDIEHIGLEHGTERELAEFHGILTGGKSPKTFAALSLHVFVIDATVRAFESGKETVIASL